MHSWRSRSNSDLQLLYWILYFNSSGYSMQKQEKIKPSLNKRLNFWRARSQTQRKENKILLRWMKQLCQLWTIWTMMAKTQEWYANLNSSFIQLSCKDQNYSWARVGYRATSKRNARIQKQNQWPHQIFGEGGNKFLVVLFILTLDMSIKE